VTGAGASAGGGESILSMPDSARHESRAGEIAPPVPSGSWPFQPLDLDLLRIYWPIPPGIGSSRFWISPSLLGSKPLAIVISYRVYPQGLEWAPWRKKTGFSSKPLNLDLWSCVSSTQVLDNYTT
jgi:hypothetical protein